MRTTQRSRVLSAALSAVALLACAWEIQAAGAQADRAAAIASLGESSKLPLEAAAAAGLVLVPKEPSTDPCALADGTANPTRPNWDLGAVTTQCGMVQTDYGWMSQPMGGGVDQWMLVSSATYGLTSKLSLRWGLTEHIAQNGGGMAPTEGVGDQLASTTYRFHDQSHWLPAVALNYGVKIPMANPAKGFGTGFTDHQFLFIASRDFGRNHFDFNTVGTLAGGKAGHDGAAQFGLALTRPVTKKLSWSVESFGGPQPGTVDRFGAGLTGLSYIVRPWLVLDGAFVKTYTAGTPRQQVLFGVTMASRPGFGPVPRGSRFAKLLGR